jgi:ankyrin repeat protein/GTP-binding protein EngB required for normal cell division
MEEDKRFGTDDRVHVDSREAVADLDALRRQEHADLEGAWELGMCPASPVLLPRVASKVVSEPAPTVSSIMKAHSLNPSSQRKVVIVIGEPGVGKSTILSSLVGDSLAFPFGTSLGVGLTTTSKCVERNGIGYIDTPGLQDVSADRRELAAREITKSLRTDGVVCKLLFVVDCVTGRIRYNDTSTIELVLKALPEETEFSVICNKVPRVLLELFRPTEKESKESLLKYFTFNNTRPQNVFCIPFDSECNLNKLIAPVEIERLHTGISLLSWLSLDSSLVRSVKQEMDEVAKLESLSRFQRLEKFAQSQLTMRSFKMAMSKDAQFWLDALNSNLKISAGVGGFMRIDDDDVSMDFWSTFPERAGGIWKFTNDRFLAVFTVLNPDPNFGLYILEQQTSKEAANTSHFTVPMLVACMFGNFCALEYLINHVVTRDSVGVLKAQYLALSNSKKIPVKERGFCLRKSRFYSTLNVNDYGAEPAAEIQFRLWSAALLLGIVQGDLELIKKIYAALPNQFNINDEMDYCVPLFEDFLGGMQRNEEARNLEPKEALFFDLHHFVEFACYIGQLDVLSFLLERGARPTPHCFAVADVEGTNLLLKARLPFTLSFDKETGLNELHAACAGGDVAVVAKVCEVVLASLESATVGSRCCAALGATPLLVACAAGKLRVVQYLFSLGAQISATDLFGRGVLHYCALFNADKHVLNWLLRVCKGETYNAVDDLGRTPLHYVAAVGNVDALWLLCACNIQVNQVDCNGFAALHYATMHGHNDCISVLIKFEANCNLTRSHAGFGPDLDPVSFLGCHSRQVPRVDDLTALTRLSFEDLKAKCEVTDVVMQPDDSKMVLAQRYFRACVRSGCGSPVHIAALNGDIVSLKTMEHLLGKRVVLNADSGHPLYLSPVHFALLSGDLACTKFLLERGAFRLSIAELIDSGFDFSVSLSDARAAAGSLRLLSDAALLRVLSFLDARALVRLGKTCRALAAFCGFGFILQDIFPELLCLGGAYRVCGGLASKGGRNKK